MEQAQKTKQRKPSKRKCREKKWKAEPPFSMMGAVAVAVAVAGKLSSEDSVDMAEITLSLFPSPLFLSLPPFLS